MKESEIDKLNQPRNYKKRETVIDDFINIIYKMLSDKVDPSAIFAYTIRTGYKGNLNTMQDYIKMMSKNNFNRCLPMNFAYKLEYPENLTVIKRNEILKYITTKNPRVKKDENIAKYLDIIKMKYGIIGVLENAYDEFYKMLMGKELDQLQNFIDKYKTSAISGFIEGIKKDITPVENAISRNESSGFVEGNNNKFKLIKRTLYGRANLDNLFKKSNVAFQPNLDNCKLKQLAQANAIN